MNWIARRVATWLAPHLAPLIAPLIEDPCIDIGRFEEVARTAVENGIIARQAVEELANALGYEVTHEGDTVTILPLNKN